jgi:hypothetical protein
MTRSGGLFWLLLCVTLISAPATRAANPKDGETCIAYTEGVSYYERTTHPDRSVTIERIDCQCHPAMPIQTEPGRWYWRCQAAE